MKTLKKILLILSIAATINPNLYAPKKDSAESKAKTDSASLSGVSERAIDAVTVAASTAKSRLSFMKSKNVRLPFVGTEDQSAPNMVRNAVLSAALANGLISENNSILRICASSVASLIGTSAALTAFIQKDTEASKDQHKWLPLIVYLIGQNSLQMFDFGSKCFLGNPFVACKDVVFANRSRREWLAIFVRNALPVLMHATTKGRDFSNKVNAFIPAGEVLDWIGSIGETKTTTA
jgi:hypothetical protein